MKALFFGPASHQLLGVYHAPEPGCDRFQGVVMCYPFGQEYMRAHRAFRQLATALSSKGYHVLRFDYRGTGDSAGEIDEVSGDDWLEDINAAVQELKDMTGINSVSLLGLRLGALLAGVATFQRRDIASLVVWDPVIDGEHYLKQARKTVSDAPFHKRRANFIEADGSLHLNGFCLPTALQQSIKAMSLLDSTPDARRVLQVASHETDAYNHLATRWQTTPGFQYRHVPAEHNWNYVDHVGGILLPRPVLKEIADWI